MGFNHGGSRRAVALSSPIDRTCVALANHAALLNTYASRIVIHKEHSAIATLGAIVKLRWVLMFIYDF